jgi:Tol biopolymer transport system component
LTLAAGIGIAWWWRRSSTPNQGPILTRLTSDSGLTTDPAISRDGKLLAYASDRGGAGNLDIWVQQIPGGEPIPITTDRQMTANLRFLRRQQNCLSV